MTQGEFLEWMKDEQGDALSRMREAESEFDGNKLWFSKGQLDVIDDVIEKLEKK